MRGAPKQFLVAGFAAAIIAAVVTRAAAAVERPAASAAIDACVAADLERAGLRAAPRCSDEVFLRRVFIDAIGTIPTIGEVRAFLDDPAPDKRARLIDRLLERDEFADTWANKWSDLLRVKAEYPINLWPNAAQAYHRWIHDAVRDDMPYDRFARALLTANGSNFRVGPVNFYRAVQNRTPSGFAQAVALTLMGTRADRWEPARLDGMAVFFAQIGSKSTAEWKEEIIFHDPSKASAPAAGPAASYPDGKPAVLSASRDPREVFADWLVRPDNPWFARAAANRIWSWMLGRGVVHEPDDFRADNPPVNAELLDALEHEFVAGGFSQKHLFRVVLNSDTYQRATLPGDDSQATAHFAAYPIRRLDAEVLIDAINQITGTTENYTSAIPEPFTYIPPGQRAIALPDGSISSPFLEMYGRPSRDTGLESERSNQATATQRLHLLNSTHIRRKLEQGPGIRETLTAGAGARESVDRLYLAILSRPPSEEERRMARDYVRGSGLAPREAALDLAWALLNTSEFLHRH